MVSMINWSENSLFQNQIWKRVKIQVQKKLGKETITSSLSSMQDARKLQQKKYCNIVSIGVQTRLTLAQERTPTEILTSDPTIVFQTSKQALDQLQKKQNKGRLNYLTKAQEQG